MRVTDPIADMLTRIRNALMADKPSVTIPGSKIKHRIAQVLKDEGYVDEVSFEEDDTQGRIHIQLRYWQESVPAIAGIRRVSTPGTRRYVNASEIPKVLDGLGICIITTSRGLMTGQDASRANVGGEVICEVW